MKTLNSRQFAIQMSANNKILEEEVKMSNQSDGANQKLRTVQDVIHAIEEKCIDGTYLFRGEPERHEDDPYYGKVSSTLWRKYREEAEYCDIEAIQNEMLIGANKHLGHVPQDVRQDFTTVMDVSKESTDDAVNFEILTEIQHYGGATNLIDFTTDYFIALFFACDGFVCEDGRVVIQETQSIKNMIRYPKNPRHRVIAQKSVFLRPPKGFIELHDDSIVVIPAKLKRPLLQHLRKYHDISTETIYNDLHGFIKHQNIHEGAYTQYYRGVARYKAEMYDEAIEHYTNAIRANPDFAYAYNNRGATYNDKKIYELAIKDFNKAINLRPDDASLYNARGVAHIGKHEYEFATSDFSKAIELNPSDAGAYNGRGTSHYRNTDFHSAIADFSQAIQLNPDLAQAYSNRGEARLHLRDWEKAKLDLIIARDKGLDIIASFRKDYESVEDFEQRNSVKLPEDIAELLTPTAD